MDYLEREEYEIVQRQVLMIGNIVEPMNLTAYLNTARRADGVGAVLDPTLYRDAVLSGNLGKLMACAESLLAFQRAFAEVKRHFEPLWEEGHSAPGVKENVSAASPPL